MLPYAKKDQHPWAVIVIAKFYSINKQRICSGTLISKKHVITASECLGQLGSSPSKIEVCGGDADRSFILEKQNNHYSDVKRNGWISNADPKYPRIAILELVKEINNTVPVCLARKEDKYETFPKKQYRLANMISVTWGISPDLGTYPKYLKINGWLPVSQIAIDDPVHIERIIPCGTEHGLEKMLCTYSTMIVKPSIYDPFYYKLCKGDAGGALLKWKDGKWSQFGIAQKRNRGQKDVCSLDEIRSRQFSGLAWTDVRKYGKFWCGQIGIACT